MVDTPKLTLPEISASQSSKEVTHNDALWALDALVMANIIDKDLSTPPGSPTSGDCYIVGATATGDWATHEDDVAQYKSTAWEFYTPNTGWVVYVDDESKWYKWGGSSWAEFAGGATFLGLTDSPSSYSGHDGKGVRVNSTPDEVEFYDLPMDIGGTYNGTFGSSQVVLRIPVTRACRFVQNLTGSQGVLGTAPTAQTDFDLQKNTVSFGTMRFAGSATTSTFICASDADFTAGDVLTVVAPASPDSTASDLGFLLKGINREGA
jgi:hypothetical protein